MVVIAVGGYAYVQQAHVLARTARVCALILYMRVAAWDAHERLYDSSGVDQELAGVQLS
jgi:hypothetical protein